MILQRLFKFSSLVQSAVAVHFRRNIGATAVAFKELDPVQKIFVDKIREYKTKRQASGGPVDTGPEYQQDLDRELFKLKQMYGKADMNTFPNFKFEGTVIQDHSGDSHVIRSKWPRHPRACLMIRADPQPKFEVFDKPQS